MNDALKSYLTKHGAQKMKVGPLREYRKEMIDTVIPEILEDVKERQRLAAEVRLNVTKREN